MLLNSCYFIKIFQIKCEKKLKVLIKMSTEAN